MPLMEATKAHWYGGRDRAVGDTFDVEPRHVTLMKALGRVRDVGGSDGEVQTRAIVANVAPTYATRDMAARGRRGGPRNGA